jgi:hypothetical protein
MKPSFLGQVVLMLALIAGGVVLWRAAQYEQRVAAAERDLSTLRYEAAADAATTPAGRIAALMPGVSRTTADARQIAATGSYWQRDFKAVALNTEAKMLAANAAYRSVRADGGTWQAVVGRLDGVVKNYAEVLRAEPEREDAAFNYEFAIRLRSTAAARKQGVAAFDSMGNDLTVHGFAGAPPGESDMKKFKMIVPMRPDERLEAEKAGKGTTKVRKG